jgi:hypothetical protein
MGGRDEGFFGGPLEEEVRIYGCYLDSTPTLCFRMLAMISGRSDESIPYSADNTEKAPEVVTEVKSVSHAISSSAMHARANTRTMAPFIAAHDIPRGVIHASQALLGYALMLAVMYVSRTFPLLLSCS